MSTSAAFKKIEEEIESLLADKKFSEALQLCNQYSVRFADNSEIIKLKRKVLEASQKHNHEFIESKIKETKIDYRNKNYEKVLKVLIPLFKIAKNDKELRSYFEKIKEEYEQQNKENLDKYIKEKESQLRRLFSNKDQFILEAAKLEKENYKNKVVRELITKLRNDFIEKEINDNKELLKSDKYEIIKNIIKSLRRIEYENQLITNLEKEIKKRKYDFAVEEKAEYIYKGEQFLDTLIKLKKYDKALIVALEILEIDPNNKIVQKIYNKIEKNLFNQIRNETVEKIISDQKNLKEEFKKNPNVFIYL